MTTNAETPAPSSRRVRVRSIVASLSDSPGGRVVGRGVEFIRTPAGAITVLLLVALALRELWLNVPSQGLIFDETYYVNAARVILGLPAPDHYTDSMPGFDPNTEHPALGKLLIAGSIALLGDNSVAWRIPSVIAGMIALVAVYLIVRSATRSAWLPVLVTGLVAFDNLTFVHGRIATLDILVLAPMLVGAWLALRKRWILAGVAMGIALLIKITALYAVAAVGLYVLLTEGPEWWRARRIPRRDLLGPIGFAIITFSIMIGGLTLLDVSLSQFPSPLDHIARIVTYGAGLKAPIDVGACPAIDSQPWQWLFNECQINYFRTDTTVRVGDVITAKYATVEFTGALNPLLASAIPLSALYTAWYAWKKRDRLAIWAVAWAGANYLPYVILALLTPRIMYIYYFLPLVPAAAIGIALLLTRSGLPRAVLWGFVAAYLVGFLAYFPFRSIP